MIEKTLSVLKYVISCSTLEQVQELYRDYLEEMRDINVGYAREATELQVSRLDAIMTSWLDRYHVNLNSSRVLVVGPHGPREGLIERQFFYNMYFSTLAI